MPKVIQMYSILYITCISLVFAASNATNKSDYEIGEQNIIEEKELIMRDDQISDKKESTKDRISPVTGKTSMINYFLFVRFLYTVVI